MGGEIKFLLGAMFIGYTFHMISLCFAEVCTVNSNCTTTICSGASSVICQHPPNTGIQEDNGLCTCASTIECIQKSDCLDATNLTCPENQRHCYDNKCICDRFPIG